MTAHAGRTWISPNVWADPIEFENNPVRQLLVPSGAVPLVTGADGELRATNDYGNWRTSRAGTTAPPDELHLRLPLTAAAGLPASSGEWLGPRSRTTPGEVLESYIGRLLFTEGDGGRPGLRRPQLGALHAVLGYWTTGKQQPATVVMPTGTGKTETMLALLVAARPPRVLVLVPSDALRTQIGRKFESLGVLQRLQVVASSALRPVVGQILHGLTEADAAFGLAEACNVIVTTAAALEKCGAAAREALISSCSHLFIDEAHHVAASTWAQVRDEFSDKSVVQFTATPFREDGRHLGGRLIYAFPLREAQKDGYFAPLKYRPVIDFEDPDRALAVAAIRVLKDDLAAGFDHVLMARVRSVTRALQLLELYEELAPEFTPITLYSSLRPRPKKEALKKLDERTSRIIVCVNMLGEGFDLPALKVAAVHEPHRSLGVTLQFIGRFARVDAGDGPPLGDATLLVSRNDLEVDHRLRALYAEDADWNLVLEDLTEVVIGGQQSASDFEAGFGSLPDAVSLRTLLPKMSTVIHKTQCNDWDPLAAIDFFGEENLLTLPIGLNASARVAWFVVEERSKVRWGDTKSVEEVGYTLFVLYWDLEHQLLYVNSSENRGQFEELARAVCGATAELVKGPKLYRVMARMRRLVPTTVGVLDIRNRSRRFSFHVGSDVSEGFPTAEAQTKHQTNIFANGYRDGVRLSVGASLKGRVWSYRVAETLKHWVDWCDVIGSDVTDESISIDSVIAAFIRPEAVQARPDLVCLAAEWPWELYSTGTTTQVSSDETTWFTLIDADLRVVAHSNAGAIHLQVATDAWTLAYEATVADGKIAYAPLAGDATLRHGRTEVSLCEWLNEVGLTFYFEDDLVLDRHGFLLRPNRSLPPFDPSQLEALDWSGINLRKESQGATRDQDSIQARVIKQVLAEHDWDLVIDDDGKGEVADIVAFREDDGRLVARLVHCKYTSASPGARIADLYEVCGQAVKSAEWRRGDMSPLFRHLERRARRKQQRTGVSPFELGDAATLYRLRERCRFLQHDFEIVIAQPGVSVQRVTPGQLQLLASTEVFALEVAHSSFRVLCSP